MKEEDAINNSRMSTSMDNNHRSPSPSSMSSPAADAQSGGSRSIGSLDDEKWEAVFNSKISFPITLTHMLESAEGMGLSHIVHWREDERSFMICDIDLFLSEVLPKFFKSSETTKIRSFYRKLNRWGFSMSRKNSKNPNNIWHHSVYNRTGAVKALNEAIEAGKAADFLNMSSRGKKRTSEKENELEEEVCFEEDDETAPTADISCSILSSRDASNSDFRFPLERVSRATSMPALRRVSSKQRKLAHGSLTSSNDQQDHNRKLLTHNSSSRSKLRHTQSTYMMGRESPNPRGSANATFDLFTSTGSSGGAPRNAIFETIQERSSPSVTFDLSLLSRPTSVTSMSSPNSLGTTTPDIFASSAREILSAHTSAPSSRLPALDIFDRRAQEVLAAPPSNASNVGRGSPMSSTSSIISGLVSPPSDIFHKRAQEVSAAPSKPSAGGIGRGASVGGTYATAPRMTTSNPSTNTKMELSGTEMSLPTVHERDLSPDEDNELRAFLGMFAKEVSHHPLPLNKTKTRRAYRGPDSLM